MKFVFYRTHVLDLIEDMETCGNTRSQAWKRLATEETAERQSQWGINSSWSIQKEGPVYRIELGGRRHSLVNWCPQPLLWAANDAWCRGDYIEYDSMNKSVAPCATDVGVETSEPPETKFKSPAKYRRRNKARKELRAKMKSDDFIVSIASVHQAYGYCDAGIKMFLAKYLPNVTETTIGTLKMLLGKVTESDWSQRLKRVVD